MPIEFLVAAELNNWDIILGESFLGNKKLNATIHNKFISLNRNNNMYKIVLFHSKPNDCIGYAKSTERIYLAPLEEKKISFDRHTAVKSGTVLIENDILLDNNFQLTPSVMKLENHKTQINIKNTSNEILTIYENSNIGLIYKVSDDYDNRKLSFKNFINILTGHKCEFEDDIDNYDISLYNSMINDNDIDEDNFENDMDKLIENNKDIVYPQDSSNEFQDNLTFLPDPIKQLETWSYKDFNIRHLDKNKCCFASSKLDVRKTDLITCDMKVNRKHKSYMSQKQRYMPRDKLKVAQEAADVLLKSGVIQL